MRTAQDISSILQKLKVGKGGKGSDHDLGDGFRVFFHESRLKGNQRQEYPYAITMSKGSARHTAYLKRDDVMSKSKGVWARDMVWRMTAEAAKRMGKSIADAIKRSQKSEG